MGPLVLCWAGIKIDTKSMSVTKKGFEYMTIVFKVSNDRACIITVVFRNSKPNQLITFLKFVNILLVLS